MTGRPIIGIWKLRTRKPGCSIVRMKYYRAWEKSEKTINQFEINVDISP
jgi:predicted secreted protein